MLYGESDEETKEEKEKWRKMNGDTFCRYLDCLNTWHPFERLKTVFGKHVYLSSSLFPHWVCARDSTSDQNQPESGGKVRWVL